MAKEITADDQDIGATYFALIRNPAGLYWTGAGNNFAAENTITVSAAAIALTAGVTFTNNFSANFPAAITTAASYTYKAYRQAGGSPAASDVLVGAVAAGKVEWDGAQEITELTTELLAVGINTPVTNIQARLGVPVAGTLASEVEGIAPALASAHGAGAWGQLGTGSNVVTQNQGGTNNLKPTVNGVGQADVTVNAYLQTDFNAGNVGTLYIRDQVKTDTSGDWIAPMHLASGTYAFTFDGVGVRFDPKENVVVP